MTKTYQTSSRFSLLACAVVGAVALSACRKQPEAPQGYIQRPRGTVTFNRDIAPILFAQCAPCHRPGQSAPFTLLAYASARKHAAEMSDATGRRYMPPWLPEAGYGEFLDARRLTLDQIGLIQQWARDGAPEGDPRDLPPTPKFSDGWQRGEPDLILRLSPAYTLASEGKDLYRNFVIPVPTTETRFVRGLEFHPDNPSVHHVRILLDTAGQSRQLDARDGAPGFSGMRVPAKFPAGHMLTWVPGKMPTFEPDGLSWILEKGSDVVLQIHMQRTGKEELIQPSIGLFFTDQPPVKMPFRIGLLSELIDIQPGDKNYVIERSFPLPCAVDALAVLPHLHYLGKELQGFAILPGGEKRWLLWIKNWDFNWQGEYRYREPVSLPQGTVLVMRYSYDNSAENPRNPNHPPRRVAYGPQSVDEMGELWLQVLPRRPQDLAALEAAHRAFSTQETAAYYERQLAADPTNAATHLALGKALGPLGRLDESIAHLRTALELQPTLAEAHYFLGMACYTQQRLDEAISEFKATLQLSPDHFHAHDGLGLVYFQMNDARRAEYHFRCALRLNPNDDVARKHLDVLPKNQGSAEN